MYINDVRISDIHEKTAKKWVYFEVETGKVKFQYGGNREPIKVQNG